MDAELIRFRLDPQVRERAEEVCAHLGYELRDVLRATVARIARDGALPFSSYIRHVVSSPASPGVAKPCRRVNHG